MIRPWRAALALTLTVCCAATATLAAQSKPPVPSSPPPANLHDRCLARYAAGDVAGAIGELDALFAPKDGPRQMRDAIADLRKRKQRPALEGLLMLHTESLFAFWLSLDVERFNPPLARLAIFTQAHNALRSLDDKSEFLRAWYLLWESFWQLSAHQPLPPALDFLAEALDAFPQDSRLQLAAGSRHELLWWGSFSNAHRDLDGDAGFVRPSLVAARDAFRRSLRADDGEIEARLRLVRVLLQLNDLDQAEREIERLRGRRSGNIMRYLGLLFEGELRERQGNADAAARAYEAAIPLVRFPHAARIARAYVAYRQGDRRAAVDHTMPALTGPVEMNDPYWVYLRGQTWHYETYLNAARKAVSR